MVRLVFPVFFAATLVSLGAAHPGEHEHHDEAAVAKQLEYAAMIKRGLANCEGHPNFVALQERAMQRRWEKAQRLRKERGLDQDVPYKLRVRRDQAALDKFELIAHNKTGQGHSASSAHSTLFASYKNSSCILTPEVTYGPYYVSGEHYRQNVVEDQAGVKVHLDYQYIDVNTCDVPEQTLYIETWSTNATGVYAGVQASGNGNQNDASNLNKTFCRGVNKVGSDGVGEFDALFPGHYTGRTTHIHLMTHINGTVFVNSTYRGSNVAHVGQLFFDDDLITAVEKTAPYNTNTQSRTYNSDDSIAQQSADNSYDPFPDWTMLGSSVSDGLLAWISIGINTSAVYEVSPAADLTANGGVASSNSVGGASGNGTGGSAPSGSMSGGPGGSAPTGGMGGTPPTGGMGGPAATVSASNGTASSANAVSGSSSNIVVAASSSTGATTAKAAITTQASGSTISKSKTTSHKSTTPVAKAKTTSAAVKKGKTSSTTKRKTTTKSKTTTKKGGRASTKSGAKATSIRKG